MCVERERERERAKRKRYHASFKRISEARDRRKRSLVEPQFLKRKRYNREQSQESEAIGGRMNVQNKFLNLLTSKFFPKTYNLRPIGTAAIKRRSKNILTYIASAIL